VVEFRDSIQVNASVADAWQVLADVESWPTWTASMSRVERRSAGPLGPGAQVRIWQPRMPPLTWTVDRFEPLEAFSWTATSPGVTSLGDHRVEAVATGVVVTLLMRQEGVLAPLSGLAYGRLTRRYLRTEVEGLKRRLEHPQADDTR
jgi:Polyketide cyclase / dehydrase and lipid transport